MEHWPTLDVLLIHLPGITAFFANTAYSTAVDSITPTGESTTNPSTPVIANNLFGLTSLPPPAQYLPSLRKTLYPANPKPVQYGTTTQALTYPMPNVRSKNFKSSLYIKSSGVTLSSLDLSCVRKKERIWPFRSGLMGLPSQNSKGAVSPCQASQT